MESSLSEDAIAFSSPDNISGEDLDLEMENISPDESDDDDDDGFKEVSLEDFLGDFSFNTDVSVSDDSAETPGEGESGDDLNLDDIDLGDFPIEEAEKESPAANPELSTQLLMKIAEELSAIRDEISSLKEEFAGIKIQPPEEEEKSGEKAGHGFFDEADDEQIALTGDELNNIINTADFIEESGDSSLKEAEETSSPPFPETAVGISETD